jgi:hypothetical protein
MGQVYLTAGLEAIPGWGEMGPEPFDLTLEDFKARLGPYQGEIKGVLTHGRVTNFCRTCQPGGLVRR